MAIIRHSFLYSALDIRPASSHSFAIWVIDLQLITLERYSFITYLRSDFSGSSPLSNNAETYSPPYQRRLRTRRRYDDRPVLSICDGLVSTRFGTSRCKTVACFLLPFVKQPCDSNSIHLFQQDRCQSDRFGSSMISACFQEQTTLWKYTPSHSPERVV